MVRVWRMLGLAKDSSGRNLTVFSHSFGQHKHWFKIIGGSSDHVVSIQVTCDCKFQAVEGIPNGMVCNHIRTAFEHWVELPNKRKVKK